VHPPCGVLSCCQRKGIEACFECDEYPCKKYDGAGLTDSFISHKNRLSDLDKAKRIGIESYATELDSKIDLLEELLSGHNDGRRKSFYCLAVNLLDLTDIQAVMEEARAAVDDDTPIKEKAATAVRLFKEMAEKRDIPLQLRKK
jgi:hypothetical protein